MPLQAERIRWLRERRGLSQDELEERLGLGGKQVYRYERGDVNANPTSENLEKLARELGCTTDYLLGLSDVPDPDPKETKLSDVEFRLITALRQNDIHGVMRSIVESGIIEYPTRNGDKPRA